MLPLKSDKYVEANCITIQKKREAREKRYYNIKKLRISIIRKDIMLPISLYYIILCQTNNVKESILYAQ